MINHYEILKVPRMSTNEEIKIKAKKLLKDIKSSSLPSKEKNKLSKQVYDSYIFLKEYHNRKSLDEYLDTKYKIIPDQENFIDNEFGNIFGFMNLIPFDLNNLGEKMKEMENKMDDRMDNKMDGNKKTYFYSSSSTTTSNIDKDGNLVTQTKEVINNNGKKDKKEYNTVTKKDKINKKSLINF
jgi:DnaJ-class molecular chaperone